jgi:hypothetical protein
MLIRQRAEAFLQAFLKDGPRTTRDIWAAAQEQHVKARTLARARKHLQIRSVRVGVAKPEQTCYWLLPGQELPRGVGIDEGMRALDEWLLRLKEQYPGRNPLDDDEER